MLAIKTENLTKKYKDIIAVDNLSLEIESGKIFALLGVNGAGKSTTIKMLSCILQPTSGDGFVFGNSINKEQQKVKSLIGLSPQETAIAPNLTVRENLKLMCGIYGLDKAKSNEKIREISKTFSLDEVLDKRASKLSGGFQRRLSIALAVIGDPKVLFLDEPTLGIDVIARSELWETIKSLKNKMTIILTTHYMEEAEELADMIVIMKSGKLIATGSVEHLKEKVGEKSFEKAFIKLVKGSEI